MSERYTLGSLGASVSPEEWEAGGLEFLKNRRLDLIEQRILALEGDAPVNWRAELATLVKMMSDEVMSPVASAAWNDARRKLLRYPASPRAETPERPTFVLPCEGGDAHA